MVLSTNSPAALKVGKQQIIPKSLASEIKLSKSNSQNVEPHRRLFKVRSMVEGLGASLGPSEDEGDAENDVDSPGSLRRGLRSTSYRRAVVSGFDFDSPTTSKKKNRMSQPVLKAVMEDKEKFSSLGRIKVRVGRSVAGKARRSPSQKQRCWGWGGGARRKPEIIVLFQFSC